MYCKCTRTQQSSPLLSAYLSISPYILPQHRLQCSPRLNADRNMAETNGETGKRTVMVTGGTGLVGSGIKEFVSTDKEVRSSLHKVYLVGSFVAKCHVVILCKQVFQLLWVSATCFSRWLDNRTRGQCKKLPAAADQARCRRSACVAFYAPRFEWGRFE